MSAAPHPRGEDLAKASSRSDRRAGRAATRTGAGVVIVGGGLAGQRCAETLRRLGYEGRIRILCREARAPYDRPPLSKQVLTGARDPASVHFRPLDWYRLHDVELLLETPACALDCSARRILLANGGGLHYDHLVVATGGRPLSVPVIPAVDGVLALRGLDDAVELRERIAARPESVLAIIGAGLIGQEVASSAHSLGAGVKLVEAAPTPMARVLPAALGQWLAQLHRGAGIEVFLASRVKGAVLRRGRVAGVRLQDGRVLPADVVLVAVGTVAATGLVSGRDGDRPGIAVDAGGHTVIPHVYAAGDAACFPDPVLGRNVPTQHWEAAAHQGNAVGRSIVGLAPRAAPLPSFWSDQHGIRLQFVGYNADIERVRVEGELERCDFTARFYRRGRLVGALLAGRSRELARVREEIRAATSPPPVPTSGPARRNGPIPNLAA